MRYIAHNRNSTVFVAERYFLIAFSRDDVVLARHTERLPPLGRLTGAAAGSNRTPIIPVNSARANQGPQHVKSASGLLLSLKSTAEVTADWLMSNAHQDGRPGDDALFVTRLPPPPVTEGLGNKPSGHDDGPSDE
jgi:hypothetical protein